MSARGFTSQTGKEWSKSMEYIVEFKFIECGSVHRTSISLDAESEQEAIKSGREWFGFDQDKIDVVDTVVRKVDDPSSNCKECR